MKNARINANKKQFSSSKVRHLEPIFQRMEGTAAPGPCQVYFCSRVWGGPCHTLARHRDLRRSARQNSNRIKSLMSTVHCISTLHVMAFPTFSGSGNACQNAPNRRGRSGSRSSESQDLSAIIAHNYFRLLDTNNVP